MTANYQVRRLFLIGILMILISIKPFAQGPYYRIMVPNCVPSPCYLFRQLTSPQEKCSDPGIKMYALPTDGIIPLGTSFIWYRHYRSCGGTPPFVFCIWLTDEVGYENYLTVTEEGTYYCKITSTTEVTETSQILVNITSTSPAITVQPQSPVTKCNGELTTFSITASGEFLTYQWEWAASNIYTNIPDATSNIYSFNCSPSQAGYFRCRVSNPCGSAPPSNSAFLTVNVVPVITKQPLSGPPVCQDKPAAFSIDAQYATGYQWQYRTSPTGGWTNCTTAPYSGYTSKDLSISSATTSMNQYQFQCIATGLCSPAAISTAATLTVNSNSAISVQPVSKTVCAGESVTYSLTATGNNLTYLWEKKAPGGSFIPAGSTSNSYSHSALASEDGYTYRCIVSNTNNCLSVTSDPVTLTVHTPPILTLNTSNIIACAGETNPITLNVSPSNQVTGLTYQESTNSGSSWGNLASTPATTTTYTLPVPQAGMNGYLYRVLASGYCAPIATSNTISLTVKTAPSITQQMPVSKTVCTGTTETLAIGVSGSSPLEYKWRKNSVSLSGSDWTTYPYYEIPNIQTTEQGTYDVIIKNVCNTNGITSDASVLTVNTAPSIIKHPEDASLCEGSQVSVSFSATISGGSNLQWEFSDNTGSGWTDLNEDLIFKNVTSNILTINSTNRMYNNFRFRCKVVGLCDPPVTTNAALLIIKTPPEIQTQPIAKTVCAGDPVNFSISATGTSPLEYKWKLGGTGITSWTSSSLLFIDEATMDNFGSYTCQVRNECAYVTPVTSDAAYLTINPSPSVSLGNDIHLCPGNTATLTPGNGYATYLWNTDETSSSIIISQGGNYEVIVTDDNNCKNSDRIFVILDNLPPPVVLGDDMSFCNGPQVLNAGAGYDFYSWNTQENSQTINISNSGVYSVTAGWNSSICRVGDTIKISFATPYQDEKICMVMIDPDTEKNMIIWEKTPDVGTEKYQVLKYTGTEYILIKETMEADTTFVLDMSSKPRIKTDAYALVSIDTCGNVSQKSPWHKPFLLQSNIGLGEVINLSWQPYLVDNEEYIFKSIVIYRGTGTDSINLVPLDTISAGIGSNTYVDEDPPLNVNLYYRIGGEKDVPCDPNHILGKKASSGPYLHSLSNLEDNRLSSNGLKITNASESLRIFPNPMKTESLIRWENPEGENFDFFIMDLKGTVVRSEKGLNTKEYLLKRESLSPGCYIVELKGSKTYHARLLVD